MRKIRSFLVAAIIMLLVSMISLLAVSTFSYIFKWQADTAMAGIIVTYIFSGFSGGISLKLLNNQKAKLRSKGVEAFVISNIFMIVLLLLSIFVLGNTFAFSSRLVMIWLLLMSSTFLGRIL